MNKLLTLAALAEAATGVILLAYPPILDRLLFDSEIAGGGYHELPRRHCSARIGAACWQAMPASL